jgi:hypothetical protein
VSALGNLKYGKSRYLHHLSIFSVSETLKFLQRLQRKQLRCIKGFPNSLEAWVSIQLFILLGYPYLELTKSLSSYPVLGNSQSEWFPILLNVDSHFPIFILSVCNLCPLNMFFPLHVFILTHFQGSPPSWSPRRHTLMMTFFFPLKFSR